MDIENKLQNCLEYIHHYTQMIRDNTHNESLCREYIKNRKKWCDNFKTISDENYWWGFSYALIVFGLSIKSLTLGAVAGVTEAVRYRNSYNRLVEQYKIYKREYDDQVENFNLGHFIDHYQNQHQ